MAYSLNGKFKDGTCKLNQIHAHTFFFHFTNIFSYKTSYNLIEKISMCKPVHTTE